MKKPMISHHVASAASGLRHVFVRDLDLMALIGIYEHEKTDPQRIIVNIDLSVMEGEGPQGDDIGHVVSYEIVVKKVEQIIAEGHINLVETLCEKIAAACLRDKRVVAARVRVEKPDIIKNARSVGVEIERQR
ncbi:dihydroneopterin aldolase [Aestuariivirga litoralis]|uniref:7,8-dihydroneopterin aldolase n=1 Tax=Aestuariivirga litoralis TaxID=2650924 RepID=A0A2W2AXF2_9HYPH|nr:dihydroneopterin aldolase [Aestuariivirga litoralis]PZF78432.1 dihydroneopterin aldolase [Aestuariivirga litoralis]